MATFSAKQLLFLTPHDWRNDLKILHSRREALLTLMAAPLLKAAQPWPATAAITPHANVLHPSLRKLIELQGPAVVVTQLSSLIKFQLGPDAWTATPTPTATSGWNALSVQSDGDTLCLQCVGSCFTGVLQHLGAASANPCRLYGLSPQQVMQHAKVCHDEARRAGLFVPAATSPAVIDEKLLQLVSLIRDSRLGDSDPDLCGLDVIFTQAGHFEAVIRHSEGRYHFEISPALEHVADHHGNLSASKVDRPLLMLESRLHPLACHRENNASVNLLHLACVVKTPSQALSVLAKMRQCTWSGCFSRQEAASSPFNPAQRTPVLVPGRNSSV